MANTVVKHSSGDVLGGAVLLLISFFIIGLAPAGYLQGVFDPSVSEGNKIPLTLVLIFLAIGVPILFFGYRLLNKRKYDVTFKEINKESCYVSIINNDNTLTPATMINYWANNVGIYISGNIETLIKWEDITSTRWRSIYNYDAYEIKTASQSYYFSFANPLESRTKARLYTATYIFLGKGAGIGAALGLTLENETLTKKLRYLHYMSIKYTHNPTKYENFLDVIFVKVIWNTFKIAVITTWFVGALAANEQFLGIAILIGVVIGFGFFFYILNIEQRLSQKLTRTTLF
jgi:hypothetical protein